MVDVIVGGVLLPPFIELMTIFAAVSLLAGSFADRLVEVFMKIGAQRLVPDSSDEAVR